MNVDDNNNWYASLNIEIEESKDETMYCSKLLELETEVTLVPKYLFKLMSKHHKEFFDIIKNNYPEQTISDEFQIAIKFLEELK